MRLEDVGRSLMKKFHTIDGRAFFGELVKPQNRAPPDNFENPRRLLRTGDRSVVQVRDVMLDSAGRRYLLAHHDDTDTVRLHQRMFRLIEVATQATWSRTMPGVDPVTRLPTDGTLHELGPIWCSMEGPTASPDGEIRVKLVRYRVITGADLQLGDFINGDHRVVTVLHLLGVTIAEVE